MARTTVPVKRVNRFDVTTYDLLSVVAGDTVNGMRMPNDGSTLLYIDNDSGLDRTIDVYVVETVDFYPVSPVAITIPASSTVNLIGPFPTGIYGNVLEFDVSGADLLFGGFSLL
jgi:hypothetical protein